jgi:integrase/recombinase XerC/integrase/recombinase XerD
MIQFSSGNISLIKDFISDRKLRELSPRTCDFYQGYLTRFMNMLDKPLLLVSKSDLATVLASLNCNAGGKHAYFRALRAFYRWACQEEILEKNPMVNMKAPKVPVPLRYSVDLAAIPVLLAACDDLRDKLIVSLLADTGLRLSELASVGVDDINLASRSITVWGKGSKQRVVCFGPFTGELLLQYLDSCNPLEVLLGLKASGVAKVLAGLQSLTGIKCNAHSFRRTFATESVRNGMNLFHVQSLLGHSSLTMTRIYAEQIGSEDAVRAYKPIVK